ARARTAHRRDPGRAWLQPGRDRGVPSERGLVERMATQAGQDLLLEQDGRTTILTFNRPLARNALTWEMYEGLFEICEQVDNDPAVRVLVLRGAGERAFVSGTDIRQFLEFKTKEDALNYEARSDRILGRLAGMNKPTIAMVQGDAVGGGLFMALAC